MALRMQILTKAKQVTQRWIWYEPSLWVAALAKSDDEGVWKPNCCLTAVPFKEEVGTPEPHSLSSDISGTDVTMNKGCRWLNGNKILIAPCWRGVQGFGLLSVCHLVMMLSVSALTFDSSGLLHLQYFSFCVNF